jgi:phosphocarrier protein
MAEISEDIPVTNQLGIHARPAAALVQLVLGYECDVFISSNGNRVNAKSIMGLLTLAATRGSILSVKCTGDDAEEAMTAIRGLFQAGFGEA